MLERAIALLLALALTSSEIGPRTPAPPPSSTGTGGSMRRDERDPVRADDPLVVRRPDTDMGVGARDA